MILRLMKLLLSCSKCLLYFFLVVFFLCNQSINAQNATTDPSEVRALNSIFRQWDLEAVDSWNISGEPCSGVALSQSDSVFEDPANNPAIRCDCSFNDSTVCHITRLRVVGLDTRGEMPKELLDLPFLTFLNIDRNFFSGHLAAFIGNMSRLEFLSIGHNDFSGPIPKELGNLKKLRTLSFSVNNFSGTLPPQLGNLVNLEQLYINSCGLGGEIPSTFANLENLQVVWASDNAFTGKVPDFVGNNWTKLIQLRFEGNSFEGPIPSSFENLISLTSLRVTDIYTESYSPLDFVRNLKNLTDLVLRNVLLAGFLPPQISELQSLQNLDLSFNNLIGSIPSNMFRMVALRHLFLGNNSLTGDIPDIPNGTLLQTIDLSYNLFSGDLPSWVDTIPQVNLVGNNFTRNSANIGLFPGLECLQRSFPCNRDAPRYANFSIKCGGLPVTSSGIVFEADNRTLGAATYDLTSSKKWAVSNIGLFSDRQNQEYVQKTSAQVRSTNAQELNRFPRPNLKVLEEPSKASAVISSLAASSSFSKLYRQPLSFSFLCAKGTRKLRDFDISKEAGGAERAIIRNFTANVTVNHLEIHLFWAGKGTSDTPEDGTYGPSISAISVVPNFIPTTVNVIPLPPKEKKYWTALIVGITVSVVVLSLTLIFAIIYIKRIKGEDDDDEEVLLGISNRPNTFSYLELKDATEDFSPSNKLGEGGFGAVYKGTFSDGRVVAVKQLTIASHHGKSQFIAEVATISAVQHRNLVKLHGYCIKGKMHLLVYEYLENKSLDQALFGRSDLHLDWPTRFNICLETARGGYLAPEYAMYGHLTEKADVFGFGIVALEILSGRPNFDNGLEDDKIYLLAWAWALHENSQYLDLVDPNLVEFDENEALRVARVALLCTQGSPSMRPPMSHVVAMLAGDIEVSSALTRPSYLTDWNFRDSTGRVVTGDTHGSGAAPNLSSVNVSEFSVITEGR
ncbi:hypothetical protein V6N13_015707 [Hibiscus sabdariffa]